MHNIIQFPLTLYSYICINVAIYTAIGIAAIYFCCVAITPVFFQNSQLTVMEALIARTEQMK